MNVFYTNHNPIIAAHDHCTIHMRKMIVEYAQLLSTAHHVLDSLTPEGIYKCTHINHPSAIWVRQSVHHYNWVLRCAMELCKMHQSVSKAPHKTLEVLKVLHQVPRNISSEGFIEPPVAAPEFYKVMGFYSGTTYAYQEYLKSKFTEWKNRPKPLTITFIYKPEWL